MIANNDTNNTYNNVAVHVALRIMEVFSDSRSTVMIGFRPLELGSSDAPMCSMFCYVVVLCCCFVVLFG